MTSEIYQQIYFWGKFGAPPVCAPRFSHGVEEEEEEEEEVNLPDSVRLSSSAILTVCTSSPVAGVFPSTEARITERSRRAPCPGNGAEGGRGSIFTLWIYKVVPPAGGGDS